MPGKHTRKRQRTDKISHSDAQPLGSVVTVLDDAEKDDEERRLESVLFGKPFVPSTKDAILSDEGEDEGELGEGHDVVGREFENLLDSDLFVVDAPITAKEDVDFDSNAIGHDEDSGDIHSDDDQQQRITVQPNASNTKVPAWTDPDDADLQISLSSNKRLRKLRDAAADDSVGGRDYERRLRRQYEKINPTPDWALAARKRVKSKRRRSSSSSTDEEDLFTSTGGILAVRDNEKPPTLSSGTISIERLRDANISAKAEGDVKAIQFHPSPDVPILFTASADRRLRLFNVDGHTNPHIQTLHIPELPVTHATFHPSGTSILLTGPRPFYYTYDLETGASHRSPRGLWGTTFSNQQTSDTNSSMETCAFNPTGKILAVASRRGYVHLVDWRSAANGSQVVGSVKMNSTVKSLWWNNEGELLSLAEDSEIYVWNVGQRRCMRRWKDDGGYGSRLLSGDQGGRYLATGSSSGIVNIYGSNETGSMGSEKPRPIKALENLTTAISTLRFNADSQLLAMASSTKKDQMRLVHLPSMTAFSNWPTSGTPLGHVSSIDFAPDSRYVAIGNNRGRVLLYRLRDFGL